MNKNVFWLALALAVSVLLNVYLFTNPKEEVKEVVKVETRTEVKYVEKTDSAPKAVSETPIAAITVPLGRTDSDSEDSECRPDTTLQQKGDSVIIPISQKVYEDSLYTAYVSGYRAKLDSIRVRERIVTEHIRESITRTKTKKYGFGLVGGMGYGVTKRNLDIFIGIGGYVNL